jgi:uncharacterized protein (UPF0248 family)
MENKLNRKERYKKVYCKRVTNDVKAEHYKDAVSVVDSLFVIVNDTRIPSLGVEQK